MKYYDVDEYLWNWLYNVIKGNKIEWLFSLYCKDRFKSLTSDVCKPFNANQFLLNFVIFLIDNFLIIFLFEMKIAIGLKVKRINVTLKNVLRPLDTGWGNVG